MKLLSLDIDGVLNHEEAYRNKEINHIYFKDFIPNYPDELDFYESFSLKSKELLNNLINEFHLKIVISSSWRSLGIDIMKEIWENEKMQGEIIGITPKLRCETNSYLNASIPRGLEIQSYLELHSFNHVNYSSERQHNICRNSGIEQYVIIDDDSDMLYNQRNNFVHVLDNVRNKSGFNEFYYHKARNIFLKTVAEINCRDFPCGL